VLVLVDVDVVGVVVDLLAQAGVGGGELVLDPRLVATGRRRSLASSPAA